MKVVSRYAVVLSLIGVVIAASTHLIRAQTTATETLGAFQFHDLDNTRNERVSFSKELERDLQNADPITRLEYAANEGNEFAMWKLGRIYSDRADNHDDHLRAFEMFKRVVKLHGDKTSYSRQAPYMASALVALGSYYRNGIDGTEVTPNKRQAWRMFYTAANIYQDPNGLFLLYDMCSEDSVTFCSTNQALRWLKLAAVKGHIGAQAQFGHRLFAGDGIKRRPVQGLMWLSIARERAHATREAWVSELHETAYVMATEAERREAGMLADDWMTTRCNDVFTC